jgi:dihydrofolate reductase
LNLILACDPNGGIGYENRLPWNKIQGDLPRFKRLTTGKIIVMGRNTWDSLAQKRLPNRINMVVTSTVSNVEGCPNVITTDADFSTASDHYWLIGGAKLIESYWPEIDEVHLTKVYDHYTCDTFIDLARLEYSFTKVYSEVFPDHVYEIWKIKS